MAKNPKKLQNKLNRISKKITRAKTIAVGEPFKTSSFQDVWDSYVIPPYSITQDAYFATSHETYYNLTKNHTKNNSKSKIEKGINKALAGAVAGVATIVAVPIVAIVDSVASIPFIAIIGIESLAKTKHNKRIEKAKIKVEKLEAEYNETLKELEKQETKQEEQTL